MCGIVGSFAISGPLDPSIRAAIRPMTRALRHRGPDGEGYFTDTYAALGHRRLAIIDRERGVQPLANEDETVWVTFNGEIYNHASLRERLEGLGHRFRTRCDTETIVHAYEEFGPDCVQYMAGMFAFAVYDARTRELFIARDRLGKKPLFYASLGGALHFSSEIKSFFHSPAWDPSCDLDQLESYLSLGYFLAPGTAYRHVRKLEPGHWLRVRNGHIERRQYWDVEQFDRYAGREADAIRSIDEQLRERVGERLESEVPLGAFLSGGIDSGLVVSYMAAASAQRIVTTSVGFGDAAHNELEDAALTAAHWSTAHHPHVIEPRLDEVFDEIVAAYDEPFADSSSVPTYYVSREARRHVTVALSGDGGDETFGGYDFRYRPHAAECAVRRLIPGRRWRSLAGVAGAHWPRSSRVPRPLRLGTVLENIGREPEEAYFADLCFLKPNAAHALMGRAPARDVRETAVYDQVTAPYRRCQSESPVQRAEYADLKIYLPNDVLTKVDRMSMLHSLEVRCPLLDHRLVEHAFNLPQRLKLAHRRGKHLLKSLAAERLPAALLQRRKRGFTAPVGQWIAGPHADRFRAEVLDSGAIVGSLLNQEQLRRCFEQHRLGERDHSYLLWAVWVLQKWCARQTQLVSASHVETAG
jgi:asparagine synthase (glutamine-hydrolysing)